MTEDIMDAPPKDAPADDQAAPKPDMPVGSSADGSSEGSGGNVDAILKRLDDFEERFSDENIAHLVDARVKSDKDIRFNEVIAEIGDMRSVVEAAGGDFSKVEGQLTIDRLNKRIDALEAGGTADLGGSSLSQEWLDAQATIDGYLMGAGLSNEDEGYKALVAKYMNKASPEAFKAAVKGYADQRMAQSQQNPASVVTDDVSVTAPKSGDSQEALESKYKEERDKIPQGDGRALEDLKRRYRKLGLGVY